MKSDLNLDALGWLSSLRLFFEVVLVVVVAVLLIYAGALKARLNTERAQHNEYIAKVTAAAVAQAALVGQKEAEARELAAQIEERGRANEDAIRAAYADARRRMRDAARADGAGQVPATAGATADPDGAAADTGVFAGLRAGGADEEACAAVTERYLLWQDFYDRVRKGAGE